MSNNRAAKSGQRQADYSNIGYAGRKTGVVLKQTSARDEYGMPALDNLFSSPQRSVSPVKPIPQVIGISRSPGTDRSDPRPNAQPDLVQHSSPRKFPPPRARSPIKTAIGSPRKSLNESPAKTMGLLASPVRMGKRGQSNANGLEDTAKNPFASIKHKRRSLEQAPKRPPVQTSAPVSQLQVPRKSVFEIPSSPAVREARSSRANGSTDLEQSPAVAPRKSPRSMKRTAENGLAVNQGASPRVNERRTEASSEADLFVSQDHTSPIPPVIEPPQTIVSPRSILQKPSIKAKGKRRLDDIEAEERSLVAKKSPLPLVQVQDVEEEFEPMVGGVDNYDAVEDVDNEPYEEAAESPAVTAPEPELQPSHTLNHSSPASKAIRQASQAQSPRRPLERQSLSQDDPQEESSQPTKRPRISPAQKMSPTSKPALKAAPAKQQKERDANIATMFGKARSQQPASSSQTVAPSQPPLGKSRPKGRGLQIMRDDTEPEIDGARYTRSGRTSVKPIEYWRGERIVYTEPRREGGRVSLPGIKEVIRMEEEPERLKSKNRKKTTKSQRPQMSIESEEDEIEQEWELDPGVFAGEVPSWDSLEQRGDVEYPEQVDLAIAPRGLELLTQQAPGTTFQYAKTLTLPFFHSGMVDLPPGGEKKAKNSRRHHIVFWVFSGRVVVDVSGNEFSLGRGGMWQVPRGNSYSVTNPHEKPARVFFAQGCYMTEEEGEAHEAAEEAAMLQE